MKIGRTRKRTRINLNQTMINSQAISKKIVTPQLLEGNAHILSILAGKIPLKCAHVLYAFAGIFRTKLD